MSVKPLHTLLLLPPTRRENRINQGWSPSKDSRGQTLQKLTFEENVNNFKIRLKSRGYPNHLIEKSISDVIFTERQLALKPKIKANKRILPFVTQYQPSVRNLKGILMKPWNLIQNQPLLKEISKEPPMISFKRGKSLKDMLVRAKL